MIPGFRTGPAPVFHCTSEFSGGASTKHVILLVDDDLNYRKTWSLILEKAGYQVLSAPNGQKALDILTSGRRVDVVMTDVDMPVMSGIKLLENLKEYPHVMAMLKVIAVLSANHREHQSNQATIKGLELPRPVCYSDKVDNDICAILEGVAAFFR